MARARHLRGLGGPRPDQGTDPRGPHLSVLAQASRTQYADRIPTWLDGLAYGENLTGGDARLHLRNRFAADRRALSNSQPMAYALIVRAWNAYAMGADMGVLRVRGEDHMPEVVQ